MKIASIVLLATVVGGSQVQTVLAADASFTEKVLYSFGNSSTDGQTPYTGLINVRGVLYGTTSAGGGTGCGAPGCGTVFSLDPGTGVEQVLYAFCAKQSCTDGYSPSALIAVKDELYGTTAFGGTANEGSVFALRGDTGKEKVLYSFCSQGNCADGEYPSGGLLDVNGTLYGTTVVGGGTNVGTVFSIDPNTKAENVVYSFSLSDGGVPYSGLIAVNGILYGTTYSGGAGDDGTVFAINPRTDAEKVLYSFCSKDDCADGDEPFAGLVNVNGTLYGTTDEGGAYDGGTVFSVEVKTGAETVIHSFGNGSDGKTPYAGLIVVKGMLYGTTESGGSANDGTVFSVDPTTGRETVLHSFLGGADGQSAWASLVAVSGTLYGTTSGGGAHGLGTVFSLTKNR